MREAWILRIRACENLQKCVVWLIGVGKGEKTLLFAKAKSSKNFYARSAGFCECVESALDSVILALFFCKILRKAQNLAMGEEGWNWVLCEIIRGI